METLVIDVNGFFYFANNISEIMADFKFFMSLTEHVKKKKKKNRVIKNVLHCDNNRVSDMNSCVSPH